MNWKIKQKLQVSVHEPMLYFERLKSNNLFRLRAGNFRVILYINFREKEIQPLSAGLKKNIYKKIKSKRIRE